jgi:hypothetical protein
VEHTASNQHRMRVAALIEPPADPVVLGLVSIDPREGSESESQTLPRGQFRSTWRCNGGGVVASEGP